MLHRDIPIYKIVSLPASGADEEQRLTWQSIALLAQRGSRTSGAGFCRALRDLLVCHESFMRLDRVALVRTLADSNMIEALDIETQISMPDNPMIPGYRCVVDPGGSLMKLSLGQIRIFRETSEVVASFAQRGMPCQRSIRLIDTMGLRSGLCMPIFSAGRRLGFLFLNSRDSGLFDRLDDQQANLLALASQAAAAELASLRDEPLGARATAEPFSALRAGQALRDRLINVHGMSDQTRIEASGEEGYFYIPPHFTLVSAAAIAAAWDGRNAPRLTLRSSVENDIAELSLSSPSFAPAPFSDLHLATAQRLASSAGYSLTISDSRISLRFTADRTRPGVGYSV